MPKVVKPRPWVELGLDNARVPDVIPEAIRAHRPAAAVREDPLLRVVELVENRGGHGDGADRSRKLRRAPDLNLRRLWESPTPGCDGGRSVEPPKVALNKSSWIIHSPT